MVQSITQADNLKLTGHDRPDLQVGLDSIQFFVKSPSIWLAGSINVSYMRFLSFKIPFLHDNLHADFSLNNAKYQIEKKNAETGRTSSQNSKHWTPNWGGC